MVKYPKKLSNIPFQGQKEPFIEPAIVFQQQLLTNLGNDISSFIICTILIFTILENSNKLAMINSTDID